MTVKCCARFCTSDQNTKSSGEKLKFFLFPSDQKVRQQWENICKNSRKENDQDQRYLCELHFDNSCFNPERLLKPDAIPRPCLKRTAEMNRPEAGQKHSKIKHLKSDLTNLMPITSKKKIPVNENELSQPKSKPYRLIIQIDKVYLKPCPKSKKINQIKINTQNLEKSQESKKNESLVKHSNTNKDEPKNPYQCLVCKEMFIDISVLYTHIKEHFTCELCGMEFTSRGSYNKHFPLHTSDVKQFPYKCHICDVLFESKERIQCHSHISSDNHNHTAHDTMQYCKTCNITCKNEIAFSHHLDSHVEKDAILDVSSVTNTTHRKILPKGPLLEPFASTIIFNCRVCSQSFTSVVEIDLHTKSHIEELKAKTTN